MCSCCENAPDSVFSGGSGGLFIRQADAEGRAAVGTAIHNLNVATMGAHEFGGNGKTQIVNYAARYALHGRVMLDGAIYLNLEHKESKQAVIQ